MNWIADHWIVLVMFAGYMVLMVYHAIVGKRRTHELSDYYVGGRSMGGIVLGLSFFATYSSTNSFVGFSGQAYSYGAAWLLLAPMAVVFSLAAWMFVAPRLRAFTEQLDSVTVPDFIGFRFDSTAARFTSALIVLFASFLYMTAIFKGIGNLLEIFLDIPYALAILVVLIVVMVYTAVGGFISVVRTDAVQGVVMAIAAVLLFAGTISAAGGFGAIADLRAAPATSELFRWDTAMPFPVLIGIIMAGTMKFLVDPRQLSRFYALKDERARKQGLWVSTITFLFVYSMLLPIGLYAHTVIGDGLTETDLVIPTLLNGATFAAPVAAFLLVAMVAAAMSSLDSVLLVMASTCERDVVGMWQRSLSDTKALKATRWYVALFAIVTAAIALNPPGQIVDLTVFSGGLYASCFFPAIVLGLYWRGGTGVGTVSSFVVGTLTYTIWRALPVSDVVHEVFPAMILATVTYVVGGMFLGKRPETVVAALFDRVEDGVRRAE